MKKNVLFKQTAFIPALPYLHTPKPLENITLTGLDVARRDLARDLAFDFINGIIYLLKIKYINIYEILFVAMSALTI